MKGADWGTGQEGGRRKGALEGRAFSWVWNSSNTSRMERGKPEGGESALEPPGTVEIKRGRTGSAT